MPRHIAANAGRVLLGLLLLLWLVPIATGGSNLGSIRGASAGMLSVASPADAPGTTPTSTPGGISTSVPSDTATDIPVSTDTATDIPVSTDTPTISLPSDTATSAPLPTDTATLVPASSATATDILPPSDTATLVPAPSATATEVPPPSDTPTLVSVSGATVTDTPSPGATRTPTPDDTGSVPSDTPTTTAANENSAVRPRPTLAVMSSRVLAGQTVGVSGSGFQPNEHVMLGLYMPGSSDEVIVPLQVSTDDSGGFAVAALAIPAAVPTGIYQLVALGAGSGERTSIAIYITSPASTLGVSPHTFSPTDSIQVVGDGFLPGENVALLLGATADSSGVSLGSIRANAFGSFDTQTVRIPFGAPAGIQQLVATGEVSNRQASVVVTVQAQAASLVLTGGTAHPGDSLGAAGTHFQPGETVNLDLVTLEGSIHLGSSPADATGTFSLANATLPIDVPTGILSILATGTSSHLSAAASLTVLTSSVSVTASPNTLRPGATLTVTGSGFGPCETLGFQLGGGSLPSLDLGQAITNNDGVVAGIQLVLPSIVPAGSYVVTVLGMTSGRVGTSRLTVLAPATHRPLLGIVPPGQAAGITYQANPGGLVQIAGSGFRPGSKVTLTLRGAFSPIVGSQPAFTIPPTLPHTTASTVRLPGGTVGARSVSAAQSSDRSMALAVVTASARGSIGPVNVTVPTQLPAGTYAVDAVTVSQYASTVLQVHNLAPHVVVQLAALSPGTPATVQGSHFAVGEQVVLALNGSALLTTPGTILTDRAGNFTAHFTTPTTIVNGANVLTASGTRSQIMVSRALTAYSTTGTHWYFANGLTTRGHRTLIAMVNPTGNATTVHMTFLYPNAPLRVFGVTIHPHAQLSVDLGVAAGWGRQVATIVEADRRIGAESIMYDGMRIVGTTLGASTPSTNWYLAEGYTGGSFQEYVTIMNPNAHYAVTDVHFLPFNGGAPKEVRFVVRPRSTLQIDASRYMPRKSISALVTANQPVVVERLMRFGKGGSAAHDAVGGTGATRIWMFAQGTISSRRQTFLTILNPNPITPAVVTASFFNRSGETIASRTIIINPLRRGNIKLNDVISQAQVATIVSSDVPVVVERAQYIGPPDLEQARAGSAVFGRNGGSSMWMFPGLNTANDNLAQIYLFNSGLVDSHVKATFYTTTGHTAIQNITVPADQYAVLQVNAVHGLPAGEVGAMVASTNGQIFIAEQIVFSPSQQSVSAIQGIP